MASDFPRSPKSLKGALVAYESDFVGSLSNIIDSQYNPEQLSRTLAHRTPAPEPNNVGAAREDAQEVVEPPVETINVTVLLDAVVRLSEPHSDSHLANGLAEHRSSTARRW